MRSIPLSDRARRRLPARTSVSLTLPPAGKGRRSVERETIEQEIAARDLEHLLLACVALAQRAGWADLLDLVAILLDEVRRRRQELDAACRALSGRCFQETAMPRGKLRFAPYPSKDAGDWINYPLSFGRSLNSPVIGVMLLYRPAYEPLVKERLSGVSPIAGGPRTLQAIGRVSRAAPGKQAATVIDFVDADVPALRGAHAQRARLYQGACA
jgi:hypothetical protein